MFSNEQSQIRCRRSHGASADFLGAGPEIGVLALVVEAAIIDGDVGVPFDTNVGRLEGVLSSCQQDRPIDGDLSVEALRSCRSRSTVVIIKVRWCQP